MSSTPVPDRTSTASGFSAPGSEGKRGSFQFGFKDVDPSSTARSSTSTWPTSSHRASTTSIFSKKGDRKVVLITGATGGIGRATSVAFAKTGKYDLALHYNSANMQSQQKLLHAINDSITRVIDVALFQGDLGTFEGVRKLWGDVVEQFGGVDVLFANAGSTGGITGAQSLADIDIETFEKTWRINTGGPILLAQLCLPFMEEQGWGRIVFCSSVAAWTGGFVGPHYASSKSGLHGFVHWLGKSVAGKGVTVNAVAPALIGGTTMMAGDGEGDGEEARERERRMAENVPVGRLGRPEEIAETVLWMVNTGYVTRKIIGVDGGYHPC